MRVVAADNSEFVCACVCCRLGLSSCLCCLMCSQNNNHGNGDKLTVFIVLLFAAEISECSLLHRVTTSQTSRLLFTAQLRPQFAYLWSESVEWCGCNISGAARLCRRQYSQYTAAARYDWREVAGMANFKMYLQFCSNRVEFFYNTQETQTQKMMQLNFDIRILWFLRIFFKFSKNVSRGLSVANLNHYGRGQTRSQ